MQPLSYQLTNTSITVVVEGKPVTVQKGSTKFNALRAALLDEEWDDARECLTDGGALDKLLKKWTDFAVVDGTVTFCNDPLPQGIQQRIVSMANSGQDPSPLLVFFKRLAQNPSKRSVDMLYTFIAHENIPIEAGGTFLAYKGVRQNLKDAHSGTFDNTPGKVHKMPRNKISDDPREACHEGFHVGALAYARGFSERVVVCRVDPADVVCVPYDSSAQKMRVSKYEVVGFYNDQPLPSTTVTEEELEVVDAALKNVKPVLAISRLSKLSPRLLLEETIDTLRAYAKSLKIVGASKIPGGKTALVKAIGKARSR